MSRPFKFQNIFKLLIAILFLYSCAKDNTIPLVITKPKVTLTLNTITNGPDSVGETYIVIRGFIADTGNAAITAAGFILSTDTINLIGGAANLIATQTKFSITGALDTARLGVNFKVRITGLTSGKRYSIAAFATNSQGTGYSTDELNTHTDFIFGTIKLLAIGDTYGGGKVAYLMQPGDTTYNANVQHGLIASISDIGQGSPWSSASTSTTVVCNALGVNLLQGISNTDSIIKYNPSPTTTAAAIAKAHRGGNYSDWYLPNKNELNKLYIGRIAIGNFATGGYWSSSEFDATNSYKFHAWFQNFTSGAQATSLKNALGFVRAIRAF
jgi:hypothetical protein